MLDCRAARSRRLPVLTSLPSPLLSSRNSRTTPSRSRRSLTRALVCTRRSLLADASDVSPRIAAKSDPIAKVTYIDNEAEFRWALCEDEMATDKLNEGIRKFAQDGETLKALLRKKLSA